MPERIVAVYSDGGVIQHNPSNIGGTWATLHVGEAGVPLWRSSGVVLPAEVGGPVTNNQTEMFALLVGLEALPDGWSGNLCSDSLVTLRRFCYSGTLRGIPDPWRDRLGTVLRRLGTLTPLLHAGHPTRAQLRAGVGRHGYPVSEHNVECDRACGLEAEKYLRQHPASVEVPRG